MEKLNVGQALYLLTLAMCAARKSIAEAAEELAGDAPGNEAAIERAAGLLKRAAAQEQEAADADLKRGIQEVVDALSF